MSNRHATMIEPARLTAGGRLRVRPAQRADRALAEALYVETAAAALKDMPGRGEAWIRGRFRAVYRRRESWILEIEENGQATAIGWLQLRETRTRITLDQIHLLAPWRNRGLGGALMAELQDAGTAAGKPIALSVLERNPALAFYQRLGFHLTGRDSYRLHLRWRPDRGS